VKYISKNILGISICKIAAIKGISASFSSLTWHTCIILFSALSVSIAIPRAVKAETSGTSPELGLPIEYYRSRGQIPTPLPRVGMKPARAEEFQTSRVTVMLDAPGCYSVDLKGQTRVTNTSIRLTNVGTQPIVNPWIVMNGTRNWYDTTSVLNEALGTELDPELRAFRLWDFLRTNRYHWYPAETTNEIHTIVKYLNVYGCGLCDDSATVLEGLFVKAGFSSARCWDITGHVIPEVVYGGQYHMLDPDLEAFYPDTDNRTVISVSTCAKQKALVERVTPGIGSLYATTSNNSIFMNRWDANFTMAMTLRPGESLERFFTNWGKYHDIYCQQEPPVYGNGKHCYTPPDAVSASGDGGKAEMITTMSLPYLYVGGQASAQVQLKDSYSRASMLFSKDQTSWTEIASIAGPYDGVLSATLDAAINTHVAAACYGFAIKLNVSTTDKSAEAHASSLSICGEIQCAPASLPTLVFNRRNNAEVTFSTTPGGMLEIEHVWEQSNTEMPIINSWAPTYPPDHGTTYTTAPSLVWQSQLPGDAEVWRSVKLAWDKDGFHPVSPVTTADGNMPNE